MLPYPSPTHGTSLAEAKSGNPQNPQLCSSHIIVYVQGRMPNMVTFTSIVATSVLYFTNIHVRQS